MHGSNSIKTNLPRYLGQSTLDIQLPHELFTVVVVLEEELQFVQKQLLVGWQRHTSHVLQQVAEVDATREGDPVGPGIQDKPAGDEVLCEQEVGNSFLFVLCEVQA